MDYERKYKEALERARKWYNNQNSSSIGKSYLYVVFPELAESEDERIRKDIIRILKGELNYTSKEDSDKYIAWLEKQGKIEQASYEIAEKEKYDFVSGQFIECRKSFDEFKEDNSYWFEYVGNDTYIGRSDNILNKSFHITPKQLYCLFTQQHCPKENNVNEETNAPIAYGKYVDECLNEASEHFFSEGEDKYSVADLFYAGVRCGKSLIEKQCEQKQFYIRFGDIPEGEKSSVWRGDEFLGKENGVSVYPAFKHNGNIVLGLSLPITKTTLHTQQHLLEYDNRPCYLVKGDYIGNGADGEPLIRNVEIVEEIKDFRVKEGEARYEVEAGNSLSVNAFDYEYATITQKDFAPKDYHDIDPHFGISVEDLMSKKNSADKVEPIFSIGDVLCDKSCTTLNKKYQPIIEILDIRNGMYICNNCSFPISQQYEYELVTKKNEPQSAWSDEDESIAESIEGALEGYEGMVSEDWEKEKDWLKSLKNRL